MLTEPFVKAKPILEKIHEHNYQAYFVGGCVRDFLLKREIGDVDITTSATPDIIMNIFEHVIPVGLEHGTVIVLYNNEPYEVTTFRLDGKYSDNRHPDSVTFISDIHRDLERRDFTINAMAMDMDGKIIDNFNGREDLERKLIRTVGRAEERFAEDPLRMIRALRFTSQLGFNIEEETLKEITKGKEKIKALAVERITREFTKLFAGEDITTAMMYFKETGVYSYLPIFENHPDIIELIPNNIQSFSSFSGIIALFHLLKPTIPVEQWIQSYRCSNKIKREAYNLIEAFTYLQNNGVDRWLAYILDDERCSDFLQLVHVFNYTDLNKESLTKLFNELPIRSRKELEINGQEITRIFPDKKAGPWIRELINQIEKKVVLGELKNKNDDIKEWIQCHPPGVN